MNTPLPQSAAKPLHANGLRRKFALLLLGVVAFGMLLTMAVGKRIMTDMSEDLGRELALSQARLTREKIQGLVGRELALAQRFAAMFALERWLVGPGDVTEQSLFEMEAEGFRRAFVDENYFVINKRTQDYYFTDKTTGALLSRRYTLDTSNPDDAWYFSTIANPARYTLNVNPDAKLKLTQLWINVRIIDGAGQTLGLTGTGLALDRFLRDMLASPSDGIISFLVDSKGRIVAHPDPTLIEYAPITRTDARKTLGNMLPGEEDQIAVGQALNAVRSGHQVQPLTVWSATGLRMLALTHLPELDWTVICVVNPDATRFLTTDTIRMTAAGVMAVTLALILSLTLGVDRIIIHPLLALTESARRMARGAYDIHVRTTAQDEIGELARAFASMADQVRTHTDDLEERVALRTAELEATHRQVTESIRYASMIQSIILPDQQLERKLHGEYFVVWRPRDVVGGDFYLYREQAHGCLFGVVDCAGHGVPGAFMTMIAHAALERALSERNWTDPAALLDRVDHIVRESLPETDRLEHLATSMDMGLCIMDRTHRHVRFAGAHIDLYLASGPRLQHVPGARSGINARKPRPFACHELNPDVDTVFYLVTDGILDQAGGEQGLAFGRRGMTRWMEDNAALPLQEQRQSLVQTLDAYQGTHRQRDDITVLAFRFTTNAAVPENAL